MKTKMLILVALLLNSFLFGNVAQETKTAMEVNSVSVLSTPDMQPLAAKWSQAFNASNSDFNVTVVPAPEKHLIIQNDQLNLLTDDDLVNDPKEDCWKMVVGRAIVVPVMSKNNTFYNEILKQGVTTKELSQLLENPQNRNWKNILGDSFDAPVQVYIQKTVLVERCLKNYFDMDKTSASIQYVDEIDDLIGKVEKNKNAIAFCQLSEVSGQQSELNTSLCFLPIDQNANGKLDRAENIYTDEASFFRGVWIGKYPKSLYRNLYLAAKSQPASRGEIQFIKWVITEGQPLLASSGYQVLVHSEVPSKLSKLEEPLQLPIVAEPTSFLPRYLIFLGILLIALIVVIELWIRTSRRHKTLRNSLQEVQKAFDVSDVKIPRGVYFDKTHTWVFMEKDGAVRMGIDDFLQHVTGSFTRVVMKSEGEKVNKGDQMLTIIQEGKQINVCAPVSGTIQSFNEELIYNTSKLNTAPFDEGWVYMIIPDNWDKEVGYLSVASKYKEWLAAEFIRLKDFVAKAISGNDPTFSAVVLQDGGELVDNVLNKLGPNVWEDFQNQFLDRS